MCIEYREVRPSASDLLQCDFLKDLDSEKNNFPIKLKIKTKIKASRHAKDETKTIEMEISPSHKVSKKEELLLTQTMMPSDLHSKKLSNVVKTHGRKRRNEQNEKESLDLFNKIEAEKNQRLNIDDENLVEDVTTASEEQSTTNWYKPNVDKNENKVEARAYPPDSHIEANKINSSFEKHDDDPIDIPHIEHTHSRDLTPTHHHSGDTGNGLTSTPHTGGHISGVHTYNQPEQNEESKKAKTEIFLKPRGFTQNGKSLKIDLIFQNPYREITFEYNLQTDTPEGVCSEMKQADFGITDAESQKIKKDISIIVSKAKDKIKKSTSISSNQESFGTPMTKVASETSNSSIDTKSSTKPPEQQVDPKSADRTKSVDKAHYAIHHFIKSVDQEIQTIVRHQNDIEQLNSSLDSETFSISMQFIKEVVDSYRSFQTKLHKARQNTKSMGQTNEPPSPNTLKHYRSFKNSEIQGLSSHRLEKQGSGHLPSSDPYKKGTPF